MSQDAPERKLKRLSAMCPPDLHAAFMGMAERSGESAGMILRGLVSEALDRGRRGEPIVRGLLASAPASAA